MPPIPEFSLDARLYAADRKACFDQMRTAGRLVVINGSHCPTRRDDMLEALRNPALSARMNVARRRPWDLMVPLMCDPPEHTGIRRILQPLFTPRGLAGLQPALQSQAAALIGDVATRGRCEAMRDIAVPFPAQAVLTRLGLPLGDRDWLADVRDAVNSGVEENAESKLVTYLTWAIQAERHRPRPGSLLSRLLTSGELSAAQVLGFCWLLVFAGTETPTAAIGFALLELARRPQLRSRLRGHPEDIEAFVDEVVRVHPPVIMVNRVATEEVTVAGVTLPTGSRATVFLEAANLEDSGSDISVTDDGKVCRQSHLGFGSGTHHCLGVHLAKMELSLIVAEWLRRIPEFKLQPGFVPEIVCDRSTTFRLATLPLRWPAT
ncbi:cytochrome P450 [Candidatus Mycobacterium methanotrophicum]|uniref:Cytochrome P450 n=1 Tax=Candidatus Mycobacterium methanotrophicum TaxID=2943498 RepID=A0ABY4QFK9_9MYCO|nr:cytochrome P450 [Candidatus Mycobacterium methanotrophicum]UQX09296.1 cytochrome P450 [Candidatus Mycobacterium methanotrophicum]